MTVIEILTDIFLGVGVGGGGNSAHKY